MKEETNDLTLGVVWKKLFRFFLPIAAGTLIQQLYNAVDGLVVGRYVGTVALAAVGGSAAQIINFLIGFFVSMTAGASVVIAQIYGAGREKDVSSAAGNAIAVCALLGLALAAFGIAFSAAMLHLLKTPADTIEASLLYLRIYFLGVPFILVLNMESNMLRSVGDSFSPFFFMVAGCIANIVLDLLFVIAFGWGVAGVAVATVLAQILNMLLLSRKFFAGQGVCRLSRGSLRIRGRYLSGMLRLGIPSGLQASMYSISNTLIQVGVNTLGTVVVASWAMTSKVDGLFWSVSNALGAAITAFVGQNIGAGKTDRVKQCVRQGMIMSFATAAVSGLVIMLLAKPLLRLLTEDHAVISTTYEMMTYFVPFYATWSIIEVLSAVMRGSGDAAGPLVIIGLGICFFRVLYIATVFHRFHTLPVLCLVYVASWVITDIAFLIRYKRGRWLVKATNRLKQ